jgi:ribonucleoside-diphosphate reductase alpha chain
VTNEDFFESRLARDIWDAKYRYSGGPAPEVSIRDTWQRVANAIARVEAGDQDGWRTRFLGVLEGFRFLPGGRILAGAGTRHATTLCNCFVMGLIEDSMEGIFEQLKEGALTMQWGGGIGVDFSTLRPQGAPAAMRNTTASGPVSFMGVWDAMCGALMSSGSRRGAMMGTLRCDHPDVRTFVNAKRAAGALQNFNLSLQVTDQFMEAVAADRPLPLCFPLAGSETAAQMRLLHWPGADVELPCRLFASVSARELWDEVMTAAFETAEPGVLFVDCINRFNNLYYREHITTTNPCGEIPLPPYGACVLGSLNLAAFVRDAYSPSAELELQELAQAAAVATRFLDNVIDCSPFPLSEQREQAQGARRIGLGLTGLADALMMLGLDYASDAGRGLAETALRCVRDAAYRTSIDLSEEKGSFPFYDRDAYLSGEYVSTLPAEIRDGIGRSGIRNSHLLAIAPTGTISLLANNISSGIEPVFAYEGERRVLDREGNPEAREAINYAYAMWRSKSAGQTTLPAHFKTAQEISAEDHLQMQAVLQPLIDNSISKTINVAEDISEKDFASIYTRAYELGLKGCTVFRPNAIRGSVLSRSPGDVIPACPLER